MSSSSTLPQRRRVLNVKALGIVIGVLLLFWLLTTWLHATQVRKTSLFLKSQATQALADDDHQKAFDLFEQYLTLNPEDLDAQESVSSLLEEHGTSRKSFLQAFRINDNLLRHDKSRDDLRVRQVRLAKRLGQFSDAANYLEALREVDTDEADVWYYSGLIARDTGDLTTAEKYFRHAVGLPGATPAAFAALSTLLSQERGRPDEGLMLLNQLVADHDGVEARRLRAAWYLDQNRPREAFADLWKALEFEPSHEQTTSMLLAAIRSARSADSRFDANGEYQNCIRHLTQVLKENPREHRLRRYLASALWATNRRDEAVAELEQGITQDPRQFTLQEVLVDYLVSLKRVEQARKVLDGIPVGVLARGHRDFMTGRVLMAEQQWNPAINAFETALGYGHDDPSMGSRARVCLAVCRRETGDDAAAVDAYRSLVQANPDFDGGRLGMASAYLRANQTTLAIAEYRELLHVNGVPEFLANLMIRHILTQPLASRDWSEVEDLLREDDPVVRDDVQRMLLKADLLFARGYPAAAMRKLDLAYRRMPGRPEIQRAHERLSSVHGDALHQRILGFLKERPGSLEGHLGMLRLLVTREDRAGIENWFNGLVEGTSWPTLSLIDRYRLIAEAATQAAEAELLTRGRGPTTDTLLVFAETSWSALAQNDNQFVYDYVRFTAAHKSVDAALQIVGTTTEQTPAPRKARCLVECLRYGTDRPDLMVRINNDLVKLIRADPADKSLRMAYANARILLKKYADAEQILTALIAYDRSHGPAHKQLALLQLLVHGNSESGLQHAQAAANSASPDAGTHAVKALALAEANRTDEALDALTRIPDEGKTIASWVYEARVLAAAGKTRQAADIVRDVSAWPSRRELSPHEADLLDRLRQELNVQPVEMTQRDL